MLGVFRSCGSDLRWLLAPLKIPSPAGLSWTSLWGALYAATAAACYPSIYYKLNATALIKKQKAAAISSATASCLFCYFCSADRSDIKAMTASFSENCFLCPDKFVEHIIRYECLDSSRKSAAVYS